MADELKTVLGFEASSAISTLKALTITINAYNKSLFQSVVITQKYNQVAKGVNAQFQKQATATKVAATAQGNLATQSKKGSQALRSVGQQAQTTAVQTAKLGNATKKAGTQMILTWQSVIRIFTIQVIHQLISKITSSLAEASREARKFEISIAEVETIAESVGLGFDQLADRAIKAAIAIGQPLDVVVEAQYQLLSNQVGNATQSFMAFEASQKLSLVAVTPLNAAVMLITGTLNAYGKSASEANTIAAKLFKTVELGRVRIAEMGDTLGRVTVLGSQLGISLNEILASIATLTIQGVKAADAMTQILNVQLKLIRPTDAMKRAFAELGVASAEVGIQAYGFQGFLQKLRDTTDGTATSVGELFGRVRATRAELGLTGPATNKYRKNFEAIRDVTAELVDQKLKLIFETNAKQVEIELNKLHIQIVENFGRGLNKILKETFDTFGGAKETMISLSAAATAAGVTFLVLRSGILYSAVNLGGFAIASDIATRKLIILRAASLSTTASIKGLTAATISFLATPLGAALVLAATILIVMRAYQKTEAAAKEYYEAVKKYNEDALKRTLKNFRKEFNARKELYAARLSELQKNLTESTSLERAAAQKSIYFEEQLHDNIVNQIKNRTSAIEAYADGITDIIDGLHSKLKDLREDSRDIKTTIDAFKFERKTKGMDDIEKYYANIQRSQDLRRKSQSEINKGEIELSKTINKEALQRAKQALATADTLKNRVLIRQAAAKVEDILEDQLDINRQAAKIERVRAAQAEKASAGVSEQVNTLQRLVKEYDELDGLISSLDSSDKKRIGLIKARLELEKEITTEFDKFAKRGKEAEALKLEEPFQKAIKALREPITGMEMDLSDIIIFDATRIAKRLQPTLDKISDEVKLRIALDLGVTIGSAEKLSKLVLKATTEYEEQGKQHEKNIDALDTINRLGTNNWKLNKDVTKTLREQDSWWAKLVRGSNAMGEALGLPGFEQFAEMDIGLDPISQQIATLGTNIEKMIRQGANIEDIDQKLTELAQIQLDAAKAGFPGIATAIEAMIQNLEGGRDALQTLKDAANIDMSPTVGSIRAIGSASATEAPKVRELVELLDRLRSQSEIGSVTVQGKSLGGMVHRQYGGFIPRGTDTIPAMLSPGEFVVNAKSTKQFFSQLVAMNAGIQPVYRQEGGSVTHVGDINITVQGAPTPQQTARETMSAFRREMRRRTSSLGDS